MKATSPEAYGLPIVYRPGRIYSGAEVSEVLGDRPRSPKASETTAAAIVSDIIADRLAVGDRLPAEAQMLAKYSVSRESLREALRLLEVQGLVYLKRGPGGGPFVAALNASFLARTATLYFNLSGARYDEVFETWAILEPPLSAKVAGLPDRGLKERAFGAHLAYDPAAHDHDEVFTDLNNFHAVIADLSGNRVLTLLTQAVNHIVVDHVVSEMDPVDQSAALVHAHQEIAEAIVHGRAKKAAVLMEEHIAEVTEFCRLHRPDRMLDPIEWR